jgi:hypothetical protein
MCLCVYSQQEDQQSLNLCRGLIKWKMNIYDLRHFLCLPSQTRAESVGRWRMQVDLQLVKHQWIMNIESTNIYFVKNRDALSWIT